MLLPLLTLSWWWDVLNVFVGRVGVSSIDVPLFFVGPFMMFCLSLHHIDRRWIITSQIVLVSIHINSLHNIEHLHRASSRLVNFGTVIYHTVEVDFSFFISWSNILLNHNVAFKFFESKLLQVLGVEDSRLWARIGCGSDLLNGYWLWIQIQIDIMVTLIHWETHSFNHSFTALVVKDRP